MPDSQPRSSLSAILTTLAAECEDHQITLGELLHNLGSRGHPFVVLLCAIPFLSPIPLPGLSILFGIFIFASGVGIMFDSEFILPKWISKRPLPATLLQKVFLFFARHLKRFEHFITPRLTTYVDFFPVRVLTGLLICISGFLLALPLPPGTNFPPALVCMFLSIGLLEKDALMVSIGMVLFVIKLYVIFNLYFYFMGFL